jgi:CBS domain-containing protein
MNTLTAKDIMNTEILVAQADWSLDQLAEFFIDNYISGAPVLSQDNELIGVVSLTDIVRQASFHGQEMQQEDIHEYYLRGLENRYAQEEITTLGLSLKPEPMGTVRDIMTPLIFDVPEDAPLKSIADTMVRGHIHRLFVTRGKQIVGIITALDMLRIMRDYG